MKSVLLHIKEFRGYGYLLGILVKMNVKKKYRNSILGIIWSLLNPLLQMIVLTIVFSNIFSRSIDNFPLYLIIGRLAFSFFSMGTTQAMTSIYTSASLLKKVYIPKYILVLSNVSSVFIITVISIIDLILVMIFTGAAFSIYLLYVPIYLILLFIFVLGIGYLLATIATFFRDMEHLYSVITLVVMYLSAIFYPVEIVPEAFRGLFYFNPVFYYITGLRDCIYSAAAPQLDNIIYCTVAAFVSLVIGSFIFNRNQDKFFRYI